MSTATSTHVGPMHARSAALTLGLGTSALAGDPDPYPRVFWALNVTPRSVKILSHGSPGAASQKPMGQRVLTGIFQ